MDDNGILARVGGPFIASGMANLQPASEVEPGTERTAELNVPELGKITITYRAATFKHGRSRRWHWVAVRADSAGSEPAQPA
jgi:hypothetical protein